MVPIYLGSDLTKGNRAVQIWMNTELIKNRENPLSFIRDISLFQCHNSA